MSKKEGLEGLYEKLKRGNWKPLTNIKIEPEGEGFKYIGTKEDLEELLMRVFINKEIEEE